MMNRSEELPHEGLVLPRRTGRGKSGILMDYRASRSPDFVTSAIVDLIAKQEHIETAARALKAISHPLRLKILCVIGSEEGETRSLADAMYAPVASRFITYDVPLDEACAAYCQTIMTLPEMQEWIAAAQLEPDDIEELEMEF